MQNTIYNDDKYHIETKGDRGKRKNERAKER